MKKILVSLLFILAIGLMGCGYTSSNIDKYLETGSQLDKDAILVMPVLEDLPESETMKYKHTHKTMLIFESDSVVLEAKYDEDTYEKEKNKLKDQFVFFKESGDSVDYKAFEDYNFKLNSYLFKIVVKDADNNTGIPKSFGMIGTSDEKKSIAYLYFCDFDLDALGYGDGSDNDDLEHDRDQQMVDFIHEYFDYDF